MNRAKQLACLLANYELDEPHCREESHFGNVTIEQLDEWLAEKHMGDCTNQPNPCARCAAEEWLFKAEWLLERMAPDADAEQG